VAALGFAGHKKNETMPLLGLVAFIKICHAEPVEVWQIFINAE